MNSTRAILIYLDNGMLMSKKVEQDWREIRKTYQEHYQTSLMPMTCEEVLCFFKDDFGEEADWPFPRAEIINFFEGNSEIMNASGLFSSQLG